MAADDPGLTTITRSLPAHGLAGRHLVVTGASGELGPAVIDRLLEAGAVCHAPVRRADGVTARARLHVTGGVDLTDQAAVSAYYAGLPPLWGSVHAAGGWAGSPLLESDLSQVRGIWEMNFVTAFLCCREAVRNMRQQPGAGGRLVNVSARGALAPAAGALAYAAAKGALSVFTQGLAAELRDDRISANAIAPDTIDTSKNRAAMPKADFTRWVTPSELAEAILWLVSPENTTVSGAIIPVWGRG